MKKNAQGQRTELEKQRRQVDFDTYDVTVDELLRRVERGRIDVAPAYQRKFQWDATRQSALVESIFLGIPVPPLFMATNAAPGKTNSWEVVDGLQRVTTLANFAGNELARSKIGLTEKPLQLAGLKKLKEFNGSTFSDLPGDLVSLFEDRPLKVVVLNDKSDRQVRFDLFERINTGGIKLSNQEVRECVFRGEFIVMIETLAKRDSLNSIIRLAVGDQSNGTREEFVLRFFAYLENYLNFEHAVKDFLDNYTIAQQDDARSDERVETFDRTFDFLVQCFPRGIRSKKGTTTVNLFEGIAVGAALALKINPDIQPMDDTSWLLEPGLREFTSSATNTRTNVRGRIEYCRDKFLGS